MEADGLYSRSDISFPDNVTSSDVTVRVAIEVADPTGLRSTTMFDLDNILEIR